MISNFLRLAIAMAIVSAEPLGCSGGGNHHKDQVIVSALRVVSVDAETESPALTMRLAYWRYLLPTLRGRSQKTLTQYSTVIGLWEQFCESNGITVSNPALNVETKSLPVDAVDQITDQQLDDFGRWLMADNPAREPSRYARSTVETYAKKIRSILRIVGPRETGNKRGANVIAFVPAMSPIGDLCDDDDQDHESIDLCDADIGKIYAACAVAKWPGDDAPLEWQTYVVCLAMLGLRVNDAARLAPDNVCLASKSPAKHSPRERQQGWLRYQQEKTGKRLILPMPRVLRFHFDALLRLHNGDRLYSWTDSKSESFAVQWRSITAQAGMSHIQRKHFRPTANLRWTLAAGDREVGAMVLGHAAADVNSKHYTRNEAILLEHVDKVAYPKEFDVDPSRGPKQMFLF